MSSANERRDVGLEGTCGFDIHAGPANYRPRVLGAQSGDGLERLNAPPTGDAASRGSIRLSKALVPARDHARR